MPATLLPAKPARCLAVTAISVLLSTGCHKSDDHRPAQEAPRQTLSIAAASDLRFTLPELITAFNAAHPNIAITPTYGSSGEFYAQITNHAPIDLFLSADRDYPLALIKANLAAEPSLFNYGQGRLVLWTRNDSPLAGKIRAATPDSLPQLLTRSTGKIAVANPAHAPYGKAAVAALKSAGLYDTLLPRLVFPENVSQAASFAASGAAECGFIALAAATSPELTAKGTYIEVPASLYPPIIQAGVIILHSGQAAPNPASPTPAELFRTFLLSDQAHQVLNNHGLIPATHPTPSR